jgi:hypothetical protein
MKLSIGFTSLVLLFSISCKTNRDDRIALPSLGYEYFPLEKGLTRIYQVDSIAYDDNTDRIDTFQFFIKEIVSGGILGQTEPKQPTEILRYASKDTSQIWTPRTSLFALKSANNLQVIEDNIGYVKLTFPLGNVSSWNGNMFNSLGRRTFLFQKKDFFYALESGMSFLKCAQIQEANINNAIEEIFAKSIYAENIGLVEFTSININTQGVKRKGFSVKQVLISHSK